MRQAIRTGENENAEFKPFVEPKNPKIEELKRTTVAFANTAGGTIFLGVNDDTTLEGVDGALMRWIASESKDGNQRSRKVESQDRARYDGLLRQALTAGITPTVPITSHYVEVDGLTILLVHVPRGTDGPYTRTAGSCFVRAGGSTRHANPDDLKRLGAGRFRRF